MSFWSFPDPVVDLLLLLLVFTRVCAGGELFERIVAQGVYTEEEASQIFKQVSIHFLSVCVMVRVSAVDHCVNTQRRRILSHSPSIASVWL